MLRENQLELAPGQFLSYGCTPYIIIIVYHVPCALNKMRDAWFFPTSLKRMYCAVESNERAKQERTRFKLRIKPNIYFQSFDNILCDQRYKADESMTVRVNFAESLFHIYTVVDGTNWFPIT